MSSAGITFSGLGSGLDTKAIIAALVAVEQRPITALQTKKTALGKQRDLFGDLGDLLDKLQQAARALQHTTDFLAMKATSDNETLLTARASSSAHPGTNDIVVVQLASAQVNASLGHADKDAATYGDATFFLTVDGVDHAVSVGAGTPFSGSLQGIADAIYAQQLDVDADVVDTGRSGSDRYQLVLRSKVTASAGAFALTLDSGGAAAQGLVDEITAHQLTAAAQAHITVNGVDVYRSSNSITDVVPGVTLDLHAADAARHVTVTVATDADETAKKVQSFVDAYNKIVDFVDEQNQLGENGTAKNPLFGDATLRSIRSSLRSIVGGTVATGNSRYSLLAQIGITSDRDGHLTFARPRFDAALVDDEQAVAGLFTDATGGIATRVATQIDVYTDSVDGLLKARRDGFDRMIQDTQRRIDQSQTRLDDYQKQLEQRFASLESLMAQLQGQGSALAGFTQAAARPN